MQGISAYIYVCVTVCMRVCMFANEKGIFCEFLLNFSCDLTIFNF